MHPQILDNLRFRRFYHGTSRANADAIAREGFRVRHGRGGDGERRASSGGALGDGIYISANPGCALYFGPVLLRVSMRPGTRILDVTEPGDRGVLASLEREFGREILSKPPRMVLSANKRLTLAETVALFRHHYVSGNFWESHPKAGFLGGSLPGSDRLHREMRSLLIRHGFQGYGDAAQWNGIVLFAGDCVRMESVALELSERQFDSDRFMAFDNGCFSGGLSPHMTEESVRKRLIELFPPGSEAYWDSPLSPAEKCANAI